MDYNELVPKIMEMIGTEKNVKSLVHCSTRLRFKLFNMSNVDIDKLKNTAGIAGVKVQSDGVHLIIGQDVDVAYDAIIKNYTFGDTSDVQNVETSNNEVKKENLFIRCMGWLADCLVPMLPALIASGLTTAVITVLNTIGILPSDSMSYKVLSEIADAVLKFIPVMVVYSTAKKLEVNPMISFAVIAVLLSTDLWTLAGESKYLYLFDVVPIRVFTYTSTIFPAIMCVVLQKYIQKLIKKIVPKMFEIFLEPLLTFIILVFIMLVVLGPIGAYIGDALASLIIWGSQDYTWLICFILAGFGNFLVGSGLHYCTIPAVIMIFTKIGYDNFYGGACFAGAFALAGAVLAVNFKTKSKDVKQVATSTGITALIGVSEPAIYGMFFKYKSVMIADTIAGCIAGLIAGILKCYSYGMAPAGITTIMMFANDTFMNLIIVITVAFILSFTISYILYSDEKEGVRVNA